MGYILTKEFAEKVEMVELNALSSRLLAMEKMTDNPMGIEVKVFGQTHTYISERIPGPSFNLIKGITDKDLHQVNDIIEHYKKRDIPIRIEVTPIHSTKKLFKSLAKHGLSQVDFHSTLYMDPFLLKKPKSTEVKIRLLEEDEFDVFADIYTRSFGLPADLKVDIARNNQILYSLDKWSFYLASINNNYAGIGVLFIDKDAAYLAAAATLPEFRNQGVHRALLDKRITVAKSHKCNLVVGQASFGSTSQNNMEKLGMRIAFTKSIWEEV